MPGEPYIYGRSVYGRWWFWLALGAIALLALALAGCQDKVIVAGCPPVVAYPPEVQKQAAAELRALPPDAILRRFIDDYSRMRDQSRACATP